MDEKDSENTTCQGFALWKYSFENHPLRNERKKHKEIYYHLMKAIVLKLAGEHPVYEKLWLLLKKEFGIIETKSVTISVENLCQMFSSKIFWHGGFRFGWADYRALLLLEATYLSWALTGNVDMRIIDKYACLLNINEKDKVLFHRYIPDIFFEDKTIERTIFSCSSIYMKRTLSYLNKKLKHERLRDKLPRYRVAVCATMSSGKSTILNALLGGSAIPFGNRACTAKILSIENDHEQNIMIGCRKTQDGSTVYAEVTNDVLEKWNEDETTRYICLSGNIKKIKSSKQVLQLYDTPGTNSSKNTAHEEVTKKYLMEYPPDLLIYVCNAEQAGTKDETDFLTWIKNNLVEKRKSEAIFVLNKMDYLDDEKENAKLFLEDVYNNLCSLGFKRPVLVPLSASAACLFRMALDGQKLTQRNKYDIKKLYKYFMEMGNDFRKLCGYSNVTYEIEQVDGSIMVGEKKYEKCDLIEAVERTGISVLEKILEYKIEGEVK